MPQEKTSDTRDRNTVSKDVDRVFETVLAGGVAIIPMNVGYAIIAATADGMKRIFEAKRRSYSKPSGNFGSHQLSRTLHILDENRRHIIDRLVTEVQLPFSVVAPYDAAHPLIKKADPFVVGTSTKSGTMDMVINCGPFHDELARQSLERGTAIFGSSANTSLSGTKYRLDDVDDDVRRAADIAIDYGAALYANDRGLSSSIIDFRDFSVVRVGIEYDRLAEAFENLFGITLKATAG